MTTRILFYTTLLFTLLITSCSNSRLLSVWVDNNLETESINRVIVIGVADNKMARRLYEDRFVSELGKEGVDAIASYKHIPEDVKITRESLDKAIKDLNLDAVILTHLLAIDEETVYHQPVNYVVTTGYYGHYYNYYPTVSNYVQSPGYYSTNKLVKLETNVYDANSAALIWSAQSSTFNPDTAKDVINPVIKLVINDMKKRKLFAQ